VVAAVYRIKMDSTVQALPEPVRHAARESLAGTYGVAGKLGPAGRALIGPANSAFVDAMHVAAVGSAVVAFIGMIVVFIWLPRRSGPVTPPGARQPDAAQAGAAQPGAAQPEERGLAGTPVDARQ
jgi:hypothetical protein